MKWPEGMHYQEAVQSPVSFSDPDLRRSQVVCDHMGLPMISSGSSAVVFEMRGPAGRAAIKCFTTSVSDRQQHYAAVSQHLARVSMPTLVTFAYLPQAILVQGQRFPILKMAWVEGRPLNVHVEQLSSAAEMSGLARRWRDLVADLRSHQIAHGDLQHGNVLVTPAGDLRLVDYDAMYVPALRGHRSTERGHENYQHPGRTSDVLGPELDSFSAFVIYLSVQALAHDPSLRVFSNGNNLIVSAKDFRAPGASAVFDQLQRSPDRTVRDLTQKLLVCLQLEHDRVPSLEAILAGKLPAPRVAGPRASTSTAASPRSPTVAHIAWIDVFAGLPAVPRSTPPTRFHAPPPPISRPIAHAALLLAVLFSVAIGVMVLASNPTLSTLAAFAVTYGAHRFGTRLGVPATLVASALLTTGGVALMSRVEWSTPTGRRVIDDPPPPPPSVDAGIVERTGLVRGRTPRPARLSAETDGAVMARLQPGAIVAILGEGGDGWTRIRTARGRELWIVSADLAEIDARAEARLVAARFDGHRPRASASYRGPIHADVDRWIQLAELPWRRSVDVLAVEGDATVIAFADGGGGRVIGYVATTHIDDGEDDSLSADEVAALLKQGRQDFFNGRYDAALAKAERVLASGATADAATLAVSAACALRSARKARQHLQRLPAGERDRLRKSCRSDGVELEP